MVRCTQISMWVSVYSCIASIAVFLYMIDHVGKALRPVSVMTRIGSLGQEVIRDVYPQPLPGTSDTPVDALALPGTAASRTFLSKRTGVVLAFDTHITLNDLHMSVGHEMCHQRQQMLGRLPLVKDPHNAEFRRMAKTVCSKLGWDLQKF